MNASLKAQLTKAVCVVTGAAALCVGLGALQINVIEALHLEAFELMIRYAVGLAGLTSLVMFLKTCSKGKC
jgi:uncharacterized membrane protein YuzA (DUF378 family)